MTVGLRLRQVGFVLLRVALLLSLTSLSGTARAEAPSWLRPLPASEECLNQEEVRLMVEASWTEAPPSDVTVQILADPQAGFLIYRGEKARFERTFEHLPAECRARQEAFAVAIVIAIDHLLQADSAEAEGALAAPPVSDSPPSNADEKEGTPQKGDVASGQSPKAAPPLNDLSSAKDASVQGPSPAPRRVPLRVRVGLSAGPLFQVLPQTGLSTELRAELLFQRFSAGVEVLRGWPVSSTLEQGSVRSHLWGLGVSTCWESDSLPVGTGLCLQGLTGRMEARASGLPGSGDSAMSYWASAGVGGALRFPARRKWGLLLMGNILGNFLRPGVAVNVGGGPDREDNAPVVGYRTSLGGFFVLP